MSALLTAPRAPRTPRPIAPAPMRADDAAAIEALLAEVAQTASGSIPVTPRMSGYLIATG